MKTNLKEAVTEFYFYQKGTAGSFMTNLFDLIQRADSKNKERLRLGFPFEVEAVEKWILASEHGNALFREYGLVE